MAMLAPHEEQARKNHDQSLDVLAKRGGISHNEALAILEDRPWLYHAPEKAANKLAELVNVWRMTH
jgi:hypothetical protein